MNTENKDPHLWEIAKKRAGFKRHLAVYLIINLFMWATWYFSTGGKNEGLPWPVWSTVGWGLGLAFHYMGAYLNTGESSIEKEYQKLKNNQ